MIVETLEVVQVLLKFIFCIHSFAFLLSVRALLFVIFVPVTPIVTSCRRAVFFPSSLAQPTELVFAVSACHVVATVILSKLPCTANRTRVCSVGMSCGCNRDSFLSV